MWNRYDVSCVYVLISCSTELAGEIKGHYPNKKVMLIHAQPALLNDRYPIKYRNALRQGAEKRGIELILGDKVDVAPEAAGEVNPRSYTTQSGKEVTADLVVLCLLLRKHLIIP